MSALREELRALWLPGIHKVSGTPPRGILGLLAAQSYQIYTPITPTSAHLTFSNWEDVTTAFAGDCVRMSTAALESVEGITPSEMLPRSAGWLLVRSYYASFFAAHALMRMFGNSLTQIDAIATQAVDAVATAYGMDAGVHLERGLYFCVADDAAKALKISKITEGSHEGMWMEFAQLVRAAIALILSQPGASLSAQRAAAKLTELEAALTDAGTSPSGNWLSLTRNRVNYQHSYGAWFPYQQRQPYYDGLFERLSWWRKDPDQISIWPHPGRDIQRYVETCVFLVALCRDIALDMSSRSPTDRSFLNDTVVHLIKRLDS